MITGEYRRLGSVVGMVTLLAGTIVFSPSAAQSSTFNPPSDSSAPSQATGGASRGGFLPPPDNTAPSSTSGGASRGTFTPPTSSAPSSTSGGASRGTFIPNATSSAPSSTSGGASRASFTPPPNSGTIQATGGASRANDYGSYINADRPVFMAALLPQTFYGTTLSAHPTVLVYLPASSAQEAVFSLKDESKQLVYQMSVPLSGKSGVVAVQIPENAPALEVGKNYQWYFAMKLEGSLSPSSPFVDGWIKRITPSSDLVQALEGKTPLQKSSILAAKGVWYDSASILSSLRTAQPNDQSLAKEWKELLESVQLSQFTTLASVPLN
jgi:hypothetical protein